MTSSSAYPTWIIPGYRDWILSHFDKMLSFESKFTIFIIFFAGIWKPKIGRRKWAQHEMGSNSTMPPLPSKPCRRLLVFTLAWTCLCFLFFRVYYNQGLDAALSSGGHLSQDSSLNTRELLQVSFSFVFWFLFKFDLTACVWLSVLQ